MVINHRRFYGGKCDSRDSLRGRGFDRDKERKACNKEKIPCDELCCIVLDVPAAFLKGDKYRAVAARKCAWGSPPAAERTRPESADVAHALTAPRLNLRLTSKES
jgi:hypothetical protein